MGAPKNTVADRLVMLKQPEVGRLIHDLRQLTNLTQVQLAEALGVAYATINRWENGHMQPSPLALKQLCGLIDQLSQFSSVTLRAGSQRLLTQFFAQ